MLPRIAANTLSCLLAGWSLAQSSAPNVAAEGSPEQSALIATSIREWVADFEKGRLGPKGMLRRGADLQPAYVAAARRAGRISDVDAERITHLDALQKLLYHAEKYPTVDLGDAVLGVAAVGLEASFLDVAALELREIGHWTLMRIDDQGVWFAILRAAAGERVPVFADLHARRDDARGDGVGVGPARRVAALHLIGRKNWPVFRSTLAAALTDADPRVRLAATESMLPPWRLDTVRKVANALVNEHHPLVSQVQVRLLLSMLQRPPRDLDPEMRELFVAGALAQFGRCGWRTDMELLEIVAAFPRKAAIPVLIQALDLEVRSPDALVTAVNKRASPLLRERAGALLRSMTGAILRADDVEGWREFWRREEKNIVVPEKLPAQRPDGTRAQFFGVPVTGGSIAFLIDVSGSMGDAPGGGPTTGPRARGEGSRLLSAKEQLVLAVQAMPPESQYYVLSFADHGRSWTPTPIKPSANSMRSLTELLSRLQPHGGTNLFEGLVAALQLQERRYGDVEAPKIDELFVLSDGEPTVGELHDADSLAKFVREANRYAQVRIHCVFTGTGEGGALLRRIADENGGVFVQR
jgi:hypothetical protein